MQEARLKNKPQKRPESQHSRDAYELGRKARREGKAREDCPFSDYPGRQFQNAWHEGYDAEAVASRVVPVAIQSVQVVTPGTFWPKDKAHPTHYLKSPPHPCASCGLVRLPSGAQAVVTSNTSALTARLRCQSCGHAFYLPIKEVQ